MANTTNFGWETPDDTDLVSQGAAAMRTLGGAIDTSLVDLKGGTTGQVLSKASNTDMDFTWVAQDDSNAIQNAIVDAKGDLISATAADTPARLGVGTDGQVLTADSSQSTGLKWATPASALTWSQRLFLASGSWEEIAYNGSNLYVIVGGSGLLYTSPDGITWTQRTSGFGTNNIKSVAYGNGLWVAVGGNGTLTTSSDGITWTARTANMSTNDINNVVYANSLWVAVGGGGGTTNTGGIIYSTDGITWTRKSQSLTVGASYRCVVWNGTNWIVGATVSTNNYLYASTPSGTWTAGSTGVGGSRVVLKIFWDGTRHTTNEQGSAYYSTSLTLGSTTSQETHTMNTTQVIGNTFYYNGKIYLVNESRAGSFTPSSSATPASDPYYFTPGLITGTSSVQSANCIFVGSAGIILGVDKSIYTSF